MQAILTRFLGPTDTKGPRIKATCACGSAFFTYDHASNSAENHARAARGLAIRNNWLNGDETDSYTLEGGDMPDGKGMCFVFVRKEVVQHEIYALIRRASMRYPHFESGEGLECLQAARAAAGLQPVDQKML
jgi:hypothetical protein